MATKNGTIKKTPVEAYEKVRKSGLIAIKLRDQDELKWVRQTSGGHNIMIVSREGKCIQFDQSDVRPMGRSSMGVRGIKLKTGDEVVEMDVVRDEKSDLLVVMENGIGKRTPVEQYRLQARGGTGVKTANLSEKTGKLVGAKVLAPDVDGDIMVLSKKGVMIRTSLAAVPRRGRATQGVYIMRTKKGDIVRSMSFIIKDVEDETPESDEKTEQTALV